MQCYILEEIRIFEKYVGIICWSNLPILQICHKFPSQLDPSAVTLALQVDFEDLQHVQYDQDPDNGVSLYPNLEHSVQQVSASSHCHPPQTNKQFYNQIHKFSSYSKPTTLEVNKITQNWSLWESQWYKGKKNG